MTYAVIRDTIRGTIRSYSQQMPSNPEKKKSRVGLHNGLIASRNVTTVKETSRDIPYVSTCTETACTHKLLTAKWSTQNLV